MRVFVCVSVVGDTARYSAAADADRTTACRLTAKRRAVLVREQIPSLRYTVHDNIYIFGDIVELTVDLFPHFLHLCISMY